MFSRSGPHHTSGKKRKSVRVHLLNGENYITFVDIKATFQDIFNQVSTYLTLRETEYFGLAFKLDGEFQFVSNEDKVYKHAPKVWRTGPGEGFDGHGQPILNLYFRVQFYVDQVVLLREKTTRHLYYLQLKDNVMNYNHGCLEERCFMMAAYALQADYGNLRSMAVTGEYFDPREYFPAWIVEKHGGAYLVENTPVVHRDLHNLPRSEAEWQFIKETSLPPAAHNLHFYRLKKRKTDKAWNAWLGICAKGIEIYEDMDDGFKDLISTFLWPDIGKLTFDKKKFEIRPMGSATGRKFTYFTESDTKSKYLLTLSRNTHMFQLAIQPKLMEIRHLDAEDKRRYRESYIYSDPRDLVSNGMRSSVSPHTPTAVGNRYSVISDVSSNTTSGIASDKMTVSFESDETSREIMIDTPPLSGILLHTPSPTRSKIVSTLPGYKPSPVPGANRSPVLDNKELFSTYTFPSANKTAASHQAHCHLTSQNNTSTGSVQSDRSGSGQSLGSGSSGSYRKRMRQHQLQQQQQQQSGMYSPILPIYPTPTSPMDIQREKTSQPASRSTSRKESFKEILAQLQMHTAELKASNIMPPSQPSLVNTPDLEHVPSFHMEDLDNRPCSRSGSSDHRTHQSYASDTSNQSYMLASISTVTSFGDYQKQPNLSHASSTSLGSSEVKLEEADELFTLPPTFVNEATLHDIPPEAMHVQSHIVMQPEVDEVPETEHSLQPDDIEEPAEEMIEESSAPSGKKVKPTHITVMNQKEILHPEIEEIRGHSNAFSLPFITALCNDKSLLPLHSNTGSIAGSYDMSSIRSTDSRISRISHDVDPRRLSVNYPSSASGTMIQTSTNRPFSWHSESFDLDAQLGYLNGGSYYPAVTDNHRSVPQSLSDFMVPAATWTNAVAYGVTSVPSVSSKQTLDRYSPELMATQLMIPPKISSGGHSNNDDGMRHKSLLKENVGIA